MKIKGRFKVSIFDKSGKLKEILRIPNGVVNDGLIKILDVMFHGDSQISTWYIGLINGSSPVLAATDVMISHPGWTENQNYSEGTRQAWVEAAAALVSGTVKMLTTTEATFSINTNGQTIGGIFITSDNTKGGTTGILWSTAAFGTAKSLDNGDTLKVEYEIAVS